MAPRAARSTQSLGGAERGAGMRTTRYFDALRSRPDRALIREEWITRTVHAPLQEYVQADGRIRRWSRVPETDNRYLRAILLPDGETVHTAFFDRRFVP